MTEGCAAGYRERILGPVEHLLVLLPGIWVFSEYLRE